MIPLEFVHVFSRRWRLLAVLNVLFFGCTFLTALLVGLFHALPPVLDSSPPLSPIVQGNWLLVFLSVFAFNLALSAFAVVTVPGFVFFPLSSVDLGYRAVLWGVLVFPLSGWSFLKVLPTLALEGEAYVFAATAGTMAGASWLRPDLAYPDAQLTRRAGFKAGLKECVSIYALVVLLLAVSSAVETATILSWH